MTQWRNTDGLTGRQMLDMPPFWLLGCIALVWLQAKLLPLGAVPFLIAALGGLLFWGGLVLIVWAIYSFRRAQTSVVPHQTPLRIITSGPFAYTRNPIYLADLMILAGVALGRGAWPSLVLVPVLMAILTRRFIAPEEARMKQSFGADFEAFAEKTPRWL